MNKLATVVLATAVVAQTHSIYSDSGNCSRSHCADENVAMPHCWCDPGKIGAGLFVTGEWLYWKAAEEGLTYAIVGDNESNLPTSPIAETTILPHAKSHQPHFKYQNGYRLGVGWTIPHDHWDVYATYTRFHTNARDSINIGPNLPDLYRLDRITFQPVTVTGPTQYIMPFWIAKLFPENLPLPMNIASAHWKLKIDMIDAELGKQFPITKWLVLGPHVGLRGGWIRQRYDLNFTRFNDALNALKPNPSVLNLWVLDMKNNFEGIGLTAGLDTKWCIGWNLSVFGNLGFSYLMGRFENTFQQAAQGFDASNILIADDFFENKSHIHTNVVITDIELGLEWNKPFAKDSCMFSIWAGYEQHVYFDQNQLMNFQYDFTLTLQPFTTEGPNYFTEGGNLSTSGFTGGMGISF